MKNLFLAFFFLAIPFFKTNAQQLDHVQGEIMVQLQPGESIRGLVSRLQNMDGVPTKVQIVRELSKPVRIWLLSFDFTKISESEFLNEIKRQPETAEAQFNHIMQLRETVPDDPNFNQQWQWVNTGQSGGTFDADVDADLAWDLTTGGKTASGDDIVVCVVEGANRNHPDLQGNLWVNEAETPNNGIDDDGNGYVDDFNGWNIGPDNDQIGVEGHGTTVSGMIGAKGNNGNLVTGINWDVKIMHVDFNGVTESNSIEAYTYPLIMRKRYNESGGTEGALVVATNSSWGIDNGNPNSSPLWCSFYDSLGAVGILSCASTSNNNVNIDIVGDLPTACSSEFMISVTASDHNDERTFSAFGIEHVDIAAPGDDIVSIGLNGGPSEQSGTSFASPLTAGIVALLYSAPCISIGQEAIGEPAVTALKVRDAIFAGVDVKANLVNEIKYGGRVNAFNSLQLLLAQCGPCPKPVGIQITELTDTQANISWISTDSTQFTNFRWRLLGDTAWINVASATSPLTLEDLLACTQYEFQLEDFCSDTTSGMTPSFIFKTDGCCEPPQNLSINNISETSALATWESVLAANAYNVKIISPQGEVLLLNIINQSLFLSDLDSCTEYQVQIQTVCDTGLTDFSLPVQFRTLGCGACTDKNYCEASALDAAQEWVENVTLNTIDNTSGTNGGYADFTGISTDLETYKQYEISLTPDFSGFSLNERWGVWIDFNQDGILGNGSEKVFSSTAASQSTVTGNIIIPGDAVPGSTRMRVIMRFDNNPASGCDSGFNFGEIEDYCVNIVPGTPPNCTLPTNLDTTLVTHESASLIWSPATDAIGYDVRIKATTASNWNVITVTAPEVSVQSLALCTEYEYQVRSNCIGVNSDWSSSFVFQTDCVNSVEDKKAAKEPELVVRPNPFSDAVFIEMKLSNAQTVKLQLHNANGQMLLQEEVWMQSGNNQVSLWEPVSLGNLPAGIYLLKAVLGENCLVQKLVKK